MKILRGGSAEVQNGKWFKFDIELDESDLQAIVIKHGLDYEKLSVVQKYQILTTQAELLVTVQMESQGLTGSESSRTFAKRFNDLIDKLTKVE